MTIQDVFYTIAAIFFTLAIIAGIFLTVLAINAYMKITRILDSVESTFTTSSRFLHKTQVGIASSLLGVLKLFR